MKCIDLKMLIEHVNILLHFSIVKRKIEIKSKSYRDFRMCRRVPLDFSEKFVYLTQQFPPALILMSINPGKCIRILQNEPVWIRTVASPPNGSILVYGSGIGTLIALGAVEAAENPG